MTFQELLEVCPFEFDGENVDGEHVAVRIVACPVEDCGGHPRFSIYNGMRKPGEWDHFAVHSFEDVVGHVAQAFGSWVSAPPGSYFTAAEGVRGLAEFGCWLALYSQVAEGQTATLH